MANLDEFFAKKDKKKSRGMKKILSVELENSLVCGDLEVTSAQPKSSEDRGKKEEIGRNEASNHQKEAVVEDEWEEYEHEKKRDYSGLKIQRLQIQEEEENPECFEEEELKDEAEVIGPWNRSNTESCQEVETNKIVPQGGLVKQGIYVPPNKRHNSALSAKKKDKREALDLNNEASFPTLSAATVIEQHAFKVKRFEQQQHGFIQQKPSRSQSSRNISEDRGHRLSLGNKFNALSRYDE